MPRLPVHNKPIQSNRCLAFTADPSRYKPRAAGVCLGCHCFPRLVTPVVSRRCRSEPLLPSLSLPIASLPLPSMRIQCCASEASRAVPSHSDPRPADAALPIQSCSSDAQTTRSYTAMPCQSGPRSAYPIRDCGSVPIADEPSQFKRLRANPLLPILSLSCYEAPRHCCLSISLRDGTFHSRRFRARPIRCCASPPSHSSASMPRLPVRFLTSVASSVRTSTAARSLVVPREVTPIPSPRCVAITAAPIKYHPITDSTGNAEPVQCCRTQPLLYLRCRAQQFHYCHSNLHRVTPSHCDALPYCVAEP